MPPKISQEDLNTLLQNPTTAESTINEYFHPVQTRPFHFEYQLRDDVEITGMPPEDMMGGVLGPVILAAANRLSRRQRLRAYERNKQNHPERPLAVSEGDSWFQHPLLQDVIDHLSKDFNILCLSAAGDEIRYMFAENEYSPALSRDHARILLLSGGGNDMMGGRFGDFLAEPTPAPSSPPAQFLNETFAAELERIVGTYETIARSVAKSHPAVSIVTHGYDYVVPRPAHAGGKWLGKAMESAGIAQPSDRNAVVHYIVDVFNTGLAAVAGAHPNVLHVDCRGTVGAGEWDDEIHPTSTGFGKVADRIRGKVQDLLRIGGT